MQPRLCVECLVSSAKLGWLLTSKHKILSRAQDFLPANEAFCNGIITCGGESSGLNQKEEELLCPRTARSSLIPARTRAPVPQKVPNPSSQVPAAASGPSLLTIGIRASVCYILPADLVPGLPSDAALSFSPAGDVLAALSHSAFPRSRRGCPCGFHWQYQRCSVKLPRLHVQPHKSASWLHSPGCLGTRAFFSGCAKSLKTNPSVLKTEREKSQRGHGVPASSWLPLWAQFLQPTGFIDLMLGCPLGPSSAAGKQQLAQTHAGKQCLDTAPCTQGSRQVLPCASGWKCPFPRGPEPVISPAQGVNGVIGAVA